METLSRLDAPAALTDEEARPFFLNRAAEDLLALGDGLSLCKGALRCANIDDHKKMTGAIAEMAGPGRARRADGWTNLQISRPSGRMAFQVAVAPAGGCAVLLVGNPEREPGIGPGTLRELFGLTPREAAVARAVCRGDSLPEIGVALGVSHNTARTHLSRILNKTGARRQSDLVKLLLSIPTAHDRQPSDRNG